jgi:hypothetical protein
LLANSLSLSPSGYSPREGGHVPARARRAQARRRRVIVRVVDGLRRERTWNNNKK